MNRVLLAAGALFLGLGAWGLISASHSQAEPGAMLETLGLMLAAYSAGVLLHRWVVLVALVGIAAMVYVLSVSEHPFSRAPLADPLHYANANGALYVQVAALAGLGAVKSRQPVVVAALVLATGAMASLPFVVGSAAAAGGAVLVVTATLLAFTPFASVLARIAAVLGLAAILATAAGTVLVAEHYGNGSPTDYECSRCPPGTTRPEPRVVAAITERRIELWRDAELLARDHPVFGVGPDRFQAVSPISLYDRDTRAAHSQLLEQAAETGLIGGLLLLAVAAMMLFGIAGSGVGLVAVTAWTAFCLHAEVDYVADFPWVVASAALVAGLGTTWRRRSALEGGPSSPGSYRRRGVSGVFGHRESRVDATFSGDADGAHQVTQGQP